MGNQYTHKSMDDFKDEWVLTCNVQHSKTLAISQTTNILAQVHWVDLPSNSSLQQNLMFYDMRQSSISGNLVNIMGAYLSDVYQFRRSRSYQIVTERLPYNFHNIRNLNGEEAIYLAYNIFQGLREIVKHLKSPFVISEKNININYFGVPKIWHREQYAMNMIHEPFGSLNSQYEMITLILRFIGSRLEIGQNIPIELANLRQNILININGALQKLEKVYKRMDIFGIRRNLMIKLLRGEPPKENVPEYVLKSLKIDLNCVFPQRVHRQNIKPASTFNYRQYSIDKQRTIRSNIPKKKPLSLRNIPLNEAPQINKRLGTSTNEGDKAQLMMNRMRSTPILVSTETNYYNMRKSSIFF